MRRRCILITGSSGRLGSSLVKLLAPDHDIVQFDLLPPKDPAQRDADRIHVGSIEDQGLVAAAFDGVDAVVHSAAVPWNTPPYERIVRYNVAGTVNLLEEAGPRKEVEQFIFLSSIRVHGVLEEVQPRFMPRFLPFDETHPYLTEEYYGGSKLQAEHWCKMYVKRFRKPAVAFRPTWICTLDQEPHLAARPAPDQPELLQYVGTSDLAEGVRCALEHDPEDGFDAFLFHADDQFSTTPSVEYVERHFPDVPIDRERLEACGGFGALVDCSHAKDKLAWRPAFLCDRP